MTLVFVDFICDINMLVSIAIRPNQGCAGKYHQRYDFRSV